MRQALAALPTSVGIPSSRHQRLYFPHEAVPRVEKLAKIAIAVEVDLEGGHSRCFTVSR